MNPALIVIAASLALALAGGHALAGETPLFLPQPVKKGTVSLEEVLQKRRSIRSYKPGALSQAQVSQLLWAAQGVTSPKGFRTAPTAGGSMPFTVYLAVRDVKGLTPGIYIYKPTSHELVLWVAGDQSAALSAASQGQHCVKTAPVTIILAAEPTKVTDRYGKRGLRYIDMEAGHIGQNIYLEATALGLGTVAVGAFKEAPVSKVLGLPEKLQPIYIFPVGVPNR